MMADYFQTFRTIVNSPKAKVSDVRWLETLPRGDYLVALNTIIERLEDFRGDDHPHDQATLDALMLIDEHAHTILAELTKQYVYTTSLLYEVDEQLWQTVTRFYKTLALAYRRFLDRGLASPANFPHDLPQLILNVLDCHRCLAKWRYFRFQPLENGDWLEMHRLYRLAENAKCESMPLWRHRNIGQTTISTLYLQALMLGSLSPSDMLKHEIELVVRWLSDWGSALLLSRDFNPAVHLFYVDLDDDKGGRRVRKLGPRDHFRYWDTDALVAILARVLVEVQQGRLPAELTLTPGARLSDCQPLIEYLLAEWSRTGYQRQRRSDPRSETNKTSSVVGGLENVCQFVKNVAYARRKGRLSDASAGNTFSQSFYLQVEGGSSMLGMAVDEWTFTNKSKHGYGAVIDAEQNIWVRLGRLIGFHGHQDPRFAVVGAIRNIKHLPAGKCYVGIEVLTRQAIYVTMRNLNPEHQSWRVDERDIFLASTVTQQGSFPFAALYMPKDESRHMPPTLIVPALEYEADANFELRSEAYVYRVRFGKVFEQKDDWVCVEALVSSNTAVSR